jgi:flavodoxin
LRRKRILVTYYTGTGNTEKVARAIRDGLNGHDVVLSPVKNVDPGTLSSYDIIFLGSGIYAFNVSRKLTTFIKKATSIPSNIAYFCTHESQKSWPNAFKSIDKLLKDYNCRILGKFDCCGENLVEKAQEQREAMYSRMTSEEKAKAEYIHLNFIKGHPDERDLENAKYFAREMLKKI